MRVRYRAQALRDLRNIRAYLAERNPRAAANIIRRIRTAAARLGEFPGIGRTGAAPGTREWKVTGAPYVIVHAIRDQMEVVILGIFHEAQLRPGQASAADED